MDHQRGHSPEGNNLNFVLPQYTPCGKNHTYHPEDWPSSGEIVIEKCERSCRFRNCKAWSQTAAALRKHVNKHIQHNNLPLKIVPASSGRTPLKIIVVQDLDTPSYDSPESLASASLQDAQPAEQVDPRNFHWKENLSSKSPIASFLHPTLPNPKQQALSRDEDHEEEQIIRTALSLLGYKVTGKVVLGADVNELARSIVGPLEVSDEQIIRAALAVLGEKMTGKKEDVRDLANRIISEREDVRDLANRIIGDGPSSWNPSTYSSNGPRANSTLPVLTENSPGSQSFGPNPTMQLPDDSGYGTTRTSTQTPVHDPHEFNFDLLDELTALAQSASRAEESQGSSSDSSGGNFFETTDWEITTPVARPTSIPPAPRLKSLPPPPRLKSMWPLLKCRVCHKTVESMSELKYIPKYLMTIRSNTDRKHHLRHRRPFLCPITGCPRKDDGFSTTNDLDRHKISEHPSSFDLTHTKRYQCHVPGCRSISRGTVWPRLDKFRSHLKRLHSEIIRSEEDFDEFVRRAEFHENGTVAGNDLDLRPLHVLADSAASAR